MAAIDQPLLETDLIRNSKKPNSLLSTHPTYLLPANQYAYFCHKYVVATQKIWLRSGNDLNALILSSVGSVAASFVLDWGFRVLMLGGEGGSGIWGVCFVTD